jgi:NitT/TauT family transport system permease protein
VSARASSGPGYEGAAVLPEARAGLVGRALGVAGHQDVIATAAVAVLVVAAMQVMSLFTPEYIMPAPRAILGATLEVLREDGRHIGITLLRWGAGVGVALVAGTALGVLMASVRRVAPYVRAALFIDTGVPALSWMLLAILWFKSTELRIFFILIVLLLPFYAMNVYEGIRALPRDWVEMVEVFRPTRGQLLALLVVPHIVPYVLLTTKSVVGYAVRMTIFAELIASAIGIGARMSLAQSVLRVDTVMAWTFLLVVLNFLIQGGVVLAERRLLGWRAEAEMR